MEIFKDLLIICGFSVFILFPMLIGYTVTFAVIFHAYVDRWLFKGMNEKKRYETIERAKW